MKPLTSAEELINLKTQIQNKLAKQEKKLQVRVHLGTCGISSGANRILEAFQHEVGKRQLADVVVLKAACIGLCGREPVATVISPKGERVIYCELTEDKVLEIVKQHLINGKVIEDWIISSDSPFLKYQEIRIMHNQDIDPMDIEEYLARDGYQALAKALYQMKPAEVLEEVKKSGIRGRGGAGFPTATKWEFVRSAPGNEKFIVCNGDEGDPGAYMNRAVLEGNPHSIIEGMVLGAYAIGNVHQGYAYVRAEYPLAIETLNHALTKVREYGLLGNNILGSDFNFDLDIFPGAGAFVCGEETALLISIEGKRGNPRQRPPFPANKGLFGKPTTINNVETWSNIPQIILKGAGWFTSVGNERSKGTKTLCLVGKINNPGLVEVPLGTSLRQIVFDIGGGIPDGKDFKAAQLGGPSGGVIPVKHLNTPVDYESVTALGAIMGSGGVVIMDEDSCMVDVAKFFLQFTRDESCGKCTACRVGIPKMLDFLNKISEGKGTLEDLDKLSELADMVASASICGLGQTAPNPVLTTIRHFREEYEAHILDKRCPAVVCQSLFKGPCQHTCPVGINVPKYVAHIAAGEFKDAIETVRDRNPFASVCGRICHHPCESKCRRRNMDEPIAIRSLKRFAADWYAKNASKLPPVKPFPRTKSQKVAIVGAGPAGLSCAYYLAQMGYGATVFEALPVGGGMLSVGLPSFRLPRNAIQEDIDYIISRGVEVKYNTPINTNFRVRQLLQNGYNAAFIAAGAQRSQRMGIPGELEDIEGLHYGLRFLRDVRIGKQIKVGRKVAVLGGGNVALDAARTALRIGAEEVDILYRRSRDEMPVTDIEYDEAVEEGIHMNFMVSPVRIDNEEWKVNGLQCIRMRLGEMDARGRRRSIPIQGSEFFVPADTIIAAIGQAPDLSFLPADSRLERTQWETLKVDPVSMATNLPNIFAGGDFVTGPGMVIHAIAAGMRAAISIDKHFRGDTSRVLLQEYKTESSDKILPAKEKSWETKPRLKVPTAHPEKRTRTFNEIELEFSAEEAKEEAARCLRCDLEVGE
jgi:NADH-quinone oxidoreductase subunit F